MLLLTTTADKVQIVTGSALTIDVHASYMDYVASPESTTPGRKNTAIATAATTDVVDPPAASTSRNVKALYIRNKDASPCDITVKHTDGTTAVELKKVTLPANAELHYIDGIGFLML